MVIVRALQLLVGGLLFALAARWGSAVLVRRRARRRTSTPYGEAVDATGRLVRLRVVPLTGSETREARALELELARAMLG